MTHGAVSRQVSMLEDHLRVALFVRGKRILKLTPEGAQFARRVSAAFDMLSSAAAQVGGGRSVMTLRVNFPPVFAMWWLIPRLGDLHSPRSKIAVEISTSIDAADFDSGRYDAAVRRVEEEPKGFFVDSFLDGRSIPVCSPGYRRQQKLRNAADVAGATLILTRSEPESWARWFRTQNLSRKQGAAQLTLDQMYLALQAALDSLGVALAPMALVENEIRRGRLCALARPRGPRSPMYALLAPRRSPKIEAIAELGRWLHSQVDALEAAGQGS